MNIYIEQEDCTHYNSHNEEEEKCAKEGGYPCRCLGVHCGDFLANMQLQTDIFEKIISERVAILLRDQKEY